MTGQARRNTSPRITKLICLSNQMAASQIQAVLLIRQSFGWSWNNTEPALNLRLGRLSVHLHRIEFPLYKHHFNSLISPSLNFQGNIRQDDPVSTSPSTPDLRRQSPTQKSVRSMVQQNRRVAGTKVAFQRMPEGRAPQQSRESAMRSLSSTAKREDAIRFSQKRIQNIFLQLGSLLRPKIPAGYMPSRSQSQSTKSIQAWRAYIPPTQTDYHPRKPQQQPRPYVISNRQVDKLYVELTFGSNLDDL